MRRFVVVSHTVPPDGQWGLDDLAGAAGRVDVLCRAVTTALFTSHGIRDDTEVLLVFPGPSTIRIRGATVQRLNPDERSTAARIRNALGHPHPDPWWEDVEPGIAVAPFGLDDALQDAPVLWLDRDGHDIMETELPDGTWVLSDHQPFGESELEVLHSRAPHRISLGDTWYHGHHAIAIVQYLLDRREA